MAFSSSSGDYVGLCFNVIYLTNQERHRKRFTTVYSPVGSAVVHNLWSRSALFHRESPLQEQQRSERSAAVSPVLLPGRLRLDELVSSLVRKPLRRYLPKPVLAKKAVCWRSQVSCGGASSPGAALLW